MNAPFKLPYKKQPGTSEIERLEKKLHFLEQRLREVEMTLLEMQEEDMSNESSEDLEGSPTRKFSRKHAKTGDKLFL